MTKQWIPIPWNWFSSAIQLPSQTRPSTILSFNDVTIRDEISATLNLNTWNHIVAVMDDSVSDSLDDLELQLYINGEPTEYGPRATRTLFPGAADDLENAHKLMFGKSQLTGSHRYYGEESLSPFEGFRGLMDDVRYYYHVLDADEVRNLYEYYVPNEVADEDDQP